MQIVVRVRKTNKISKSNYKVIADIDARTIPDDIPLTSRAIDHYKTNRIAFSAGYVDFKTLKLKDLESIISASKRGEVRLISERFRRCAEYKII